MRWTYRRDPSGTESWTGEPVELPAKVPLPPGFWDKPVPGLGVRRRTAAALTVGVPLGGTIGEHMLNGPGAVRGGLGAAAGAALAAWASGRSWD